MNPRRHVSAVLALGLAAALTGCVKTDLSATITPDSRVAGTLIVGVSTDNLDNLGGQDTVDALRGDVVGLSAGASVKQSNYTDTDFTGVRAVFARLSLTDLSSLLEAKTEALAGSGQFPSDAITLKVTKTSDRYRVVGVIDLRDEDDRENDAPGSDQGGFGGGDTPQVKIALRFPGKVLKKDRFAVAKGNGLTWSGRPGRKVTISAEAALK